MNNLLIISCIFGKQFKKGRLDVGVREFDAKFKEYIYVRPGA